MAYDAVTHTVVLLDAGQTWTWGGSAWTERSPATSPPALFNASMTYDAAARTVVLFGGTEAGHSGPLNQTWTWNGSDWTKRVPATSPPARGQASMAYDAATRRVVLFGGDGRGPRRDTWTWNGTTWTQRTPTTSPSARYEASMAYDAATGVVTLFGGRTFGGVQSDQTWTWNGSTWAKQAPTTSPGARVMASMAYDAATSTAVLFGGVVSLSVVNDTWTWNGITWAQQAPAAWPPAREEAVMAYDVASHQVVLYHEFGLGADRQ